jgi:hypothetical protein
MKRECWEILEEIGIYWEFIKRVCILENHIVEVVGILRNGIWPCESVM